MKTRGHGFRQAEEQKISALGFKKLGRLWLESPISSQFIASWAL